MEHTERNEETIAEEELEELELVSEPNGLQRPNTRFSDDNTRPLQVDTYWQYQRLFERGSLNGQLPDIVELPSVDDIPVFEFEATSDDYYVLLLARWQFLPADRSLSIASLLLHCYTPGPLGQSGKSIFGFYWADGGFREFSGIPSAHLEKFIFEQISNSKIRNLVRSYPVRIEDFGRNSEATKQISLRLLFQESVNIRDFWSLTGEPERQRSVPFLSQAYFSGHRSGMKIEERETLEALVGKSLTPASMMHVLISSTKIDGANLRLSYEAEIEGMNSDPVYRAMDTKQSHLEGRLWEFATGFWLFFDSPPESLWLKVIAVSET